MTVKCNMPAGIAAAIAFGPYQRRNIRSMKIITVVEIVETTNGNDTRSTSRPPQGRVHQS
jgi:hypothetical protein